MKNVFGFTLVEVLAVIVILAIITVIAVPLVGTIIENVRKESFESSVKGIAKSVENDYVMRSITGTNEDVLYTFEDGVQTTSPSYVKELEYTDSLPFDGFIKVYADGNYDLVLSDSKYYVNKLSTNEELSPIIDYSSQTLTPDEFLNGLNANAPLLATGMTPIKWDGSTWINTVSTDPEWYDYNAKKWANVRTLDGSFWVWIPRYAYRIESGFHTNVAGKIDVKFLEGTSNNAGGINVELSPKYSGSSQTNYVLHPAFTLGTEAIEGFWVAKFQASKESTSNVTSKPNVITWGGATISQAFTNCRNIRTKPALYGFVAGEIDSFLMSNKNWGAIAYLSQSEKGKNSKVWVNNNSSYTTGCGGDSATAATTTGCNQYHTANGQNASTTGNIYGVYDMNGGGWELTSSYIDNGDPILASDASTLVTSNLRYKDPYLPGSTDTDQNNYLANASTLTNGKFGDAIYETSSLHSGWNSWYGENSAMPRTTMPFFSRGGRAQSPEQSGLYSFMIGYIGGMSYYAFRPIIVIN